MWGHYIGELLAQTSDTDEGRAFVLDRVCTPEMLGSSLVDPARRFFEELDGATLAQYLVGGVLKAHLHSRAAQSLTWSWGPRCTTCSLERDPVAGT
ncbi:MAG: hypothetical protein ACP5PB_03015 [Acidimicrobiales bacterium]